MELAGTPVEASTDRLSHPDPSTDHVQLPDSSNGRLQHLEPSTARLRRLYRFMAGRDFVASRGELIACGFSPSQIKNWARNGRLVTIVRSVYSYGRDVQARDAVLRAALLVAGSDATLVGRSSCERWGIVEPRPGLPQRVEVGSLHGQARTFKGLSPALRGLTVRVVSRSFDRDDLRTSNGLSLTRPALALADLAANSTDPEIRFAFLEACRLRLFERQDLEYCYSRLDRRRGIGKLKPYLALWVPELQRTRSVYEGWYLLVWVGREYPMPRVNEKVFGCEVDLFWPERGFVLELDGHAFHSDPAQRRLDREKQLHLESSGLQVERMPYKVFARDPVGEVDRIAQHLGFC